MEETTMLHTQINALQQHAQNFRNAIMSVDPEKERDVFFYKFPNGQCGNTSKLLARYLFEKGYSHIIYETGVYRWDGYDWDEYPAHKPQEHTWLLVDKLVVDITGDQLADAPSPITNTTEIYVGSKSPYYVQFDVHSTGKVKLTDGNSAFIRDEHLDKLYRIIKQYLEN